MLRLEIPPKDEVLQSYCQYGASISSLARKYNTSNPTIRKWLDYHGIPKKGHKKASTEANNLRRVNVPTKEDLIRTYIDLKYTKKQMEAHYNVGQETLYQWLDSYDIPRRSLSDACILAKQNQHKDIYYGRKEVLGVLESNQHNKLKSAKDLNISLSHLKKLIKDHEIVSSDISYKSSAELDLLEYCKTLRPDCTWLSGNRSIINPYELDIYCPDLDFAIEYCGLYWHSEFFGQKKKDYHFQKWKKCKEKGVTLITVFENDNINLIQRLIRKKLFASEKIYARNCKVEKLNSKISNDFHSQHHIHGTVGGSTHYGLIYENNLKIVLSLGKSRFSDTYDWECTRMTNSDDSVIIGGASKLFKAFIRYEQPKSIITFADLRFGNGSVYNHCDFKFQAYTNPNYWYFYKNNISKMYSRIAFQKHKLEEKLDLYNPKDTEYQNMLNNGYDRIWDCGNAKYVYKS